MQMFKWVTLFTFLAGGLYADSITLTFEGISNGALVNQYYNGFSDSLSESGTNYGVRFYAARGLVSDQAPSAGTGQQYYYTLDSTFGSQPSPWTGIDAYGSSTFVMDLSNFVNIYGAVTGISFYYADLQKNDSPLQVNAYTTGKGHLNTSSNQVYTDNSAPYTPDGSLLNGCLGQQYCPFSLYTVPSSVFTTNSILSLDIGAGSPGLVMVDDITITYAPTNTPEPSTMALVTGGLVLLGSGRLFPRRKKIS